MVAASRATPGSVHTCGHSSSRLPKEIPDDARGRLDLHYFTRIQLDFAQETCLWFSCLSLRSEITRLAAVLETFWLETGRTHSFLFACNNWL